MTLVAALKVINDVFYPLSAVIVAVYTTLDLVQLSAPITSNAGICIYFAGLLCKIVTGGCVVGTIVTVCKDVAHE